VFTAYHAKYYAQELVRHHASNGVGRLSQSLFDASVDLNPHQIDAALFALRNPLQEGVLLADEEVLKNTKARIAQLRCDAHKAVTLQEQDSIQRELSELERKHRKQRQEIFDVEDEIIAKRDELVEILQHRMQEKTETRTLFTLRWQLV
jgi:septal ring factor EnvC (AmiA/AmiB activator)